MKKIILNILIIALFASGSFYLTLPLIADGLATQAAAEQKRFFFESAEALYKRAIRTEPLNSRHYFNLASFYTVTNYWELRPDTEKLFLKSERLNPSSADTQIGLSNYYLKSGDLSSAMVRVNRAIKLDPNNAALHLNLCYLYRATGDIENSKEEFKIALMRLPATWNYELLKNKETAPVYLDAAIAGLEERLKASPRDGGTYGVLADLYNRKGDREKAISCYKESVKLAKDNPWTYLGLSYAYESRKDMEEALAAIKSASKLFPQNYHIYRRLADLYGKIGLADEAKDAFSAAVRLNAKDTALRNEYINFLLSQKLLDDATTEARRLVYDFPANTDAIYKLVQVYKAAGKYQLAAIELQRIISLKPGEKKYQDELADLYRTVSS